MSSQSSQSPLPVSLTPSLQIQDPLAAWWISQVTLRLRREICWCWHQRSGRRDPGGGKLPPLTDPAAESLDLVRHENEKKAFFDQDVTARYLSDQILSSDPPQAGEKVRGSWSWVAWRLGLEPAAQFVLALGLAARLDAGLGPVLAACHNDAARPYPTLSLAQKLWEEPLEVLACADKGHPLFRFGLLTARHSELDWNEPLLLPGAVAQVLVKESISLPRGLMPARTGKPIELQESQHLLIARLLDSQREGMQVVPLLGPEGADFEGWGFELSSRSGHRAVRVSELAASPEELQPLATFCWLCGLDVVLPEGWLNCCGAKDSSALPASIEAIPVRWFAALTEQSQATRFPARAMLPVCRISALTFQQRASHLKEGLGQRAARLDSEIEECARRFRLEQKALDNIIRTLKALDGPLSAASLSQACRNEVRAGLEGLIQKVNPRFSRHELILPGTPARQFDEIITAMGALTRVHYHWGTARAWNESGLSVMFCGVPGTGKTMAAEVLSNTLQLPMYRIDLSQVVNKYIGETEKNLKRIFDLAEQSDCILFFDEADALFGKRTEVKDAHDRFANIEISYLLERMERFKGLAILATNRRKDLDEAFIRRLRYIIEFPVPGVAERRQIWQLVFPQGVDVSEIDFDYLAKHFQLSGGHIRSVAFNACLQSAGKGGGQARKVKMETLLLALKRELEKLNRSLGNQIFGRYSKLVPEEVAS